MNITDKIRSLNQSLKDAKPSFAGKTINIEICGSCNEQCIYCPYYAHGSHRTKGVIDEGLFYKIASEAYEIGITDVGLYIAGEPLLNPKVYDYVDYLKHKLHFPYVFISTNGILLVPASIKKLGESGIDSIKFSVAGANRGTFKRHHGVDKFETVYENIKYAFDYRKKNGLRYGLYLYVILTRYNIHEKEEFIRLYAPYVDEIVFSPVASCRTVYGVKEYLSTEEYNETLQGMGGSVPCNDLYSKIFVDEKGRLRICCYDLSNDLSVIADLTKISLKEAVYSEKFVRLRQKHLDGDVSGTVCDFCINGNVHGIEPFVDFVDVNELAKKADVSSEIKSRFSEMEAE